MPSYPGFARFNPLCSQVTQCSAKEMKALRRVIIPVYAATLSNRCARHRIPCTEALLCVQNIVYFHLMAHCQYHTEATIWYMEKQLEEFHDHKDIFIRFCASQPKKTVSEAFMQQHCVDKQQDLESDPTWNNLLMPAKCHFVDEDGKQIKA